MDSLTKNDSFFVEGSGKAVITNDDGKVSLLHLQDMTLELSGKMEDIYGGESIFSLYSFVTEKGASATFTNASMSLDLITSSQGTKASTNVVVFKTDNVTVGSGGEITLTETTIEDDSIVATDKDGKVVAVTGTGGTYTVDTTLAGESIEVFYRYTITKDAVGTSILTTSIPSYVTIYHESKPLKQKDGRIIKIFTTIYKARCDGSLKLNFKQKNAFAPELKFNAVDPERADGKFVDFAIKDVTDEVDD